MSSDSADPFYWMRVILASNRGKFYNLYIFLTRPKFKPVTVKLDLVVRVKNFTTSSAVFS